MRNVKHIAASPSAPVLMLLHGIVFLFAITYYMGAPWKREYTIGLYALAVIWGGVLVLQRFRARRPVLNRIDYLFATFLLAVCISITNHWWEGSIKQVQQIPFFLVAPYILGRAMRPEDGLILRSVLAVAGIFLLLLVIPEYLRYMNYGFPYRDSPYPVLFGKNIGAMMSGLLFASALISSISILLVQKSKNDRPPQDARRLRFITYAGLALMLVAATWVGSRGPLLVAIVGVCVLLFITPTTSKTTKLAIILVLGVSSIVAIAVTLQRHASVQHFVRLVQFPTEITGEIESNINSSKQAAGSLSVLGPAACDRIVDSISERWIHVQQATALAINNPVTGVGANQYGFYACQGPGAFPHNVILQVFAELGMIVGAVYFCLLWMSMLAPIRLLKSINKSEWKHLSYWLIVFSAIQILFALISGDYFTSTPLYLVMGMAAKLCDHVQNETA